MHIILTGATGTVGSQVLKHCLESPIVSQLSVLSRRTFDLPSEKAKVIVHKDYTSYPDELLAQLKGADACIWSLGISQNEVSKE